MLDLLFFSPYIFHLMVVHKNSVKSATETCEIVVYFYVYIKAELIEKHV